MLAILCIGSISAWTSEKFVEDTQKIEEKSLELGSEIKTKYGTYEIIEHKWWDILKIWTEEIVVEKTLIDNTDQCLINCESSGTTILYKDGVLFDKINFVNKNGNNKEIDYQILIKQIEYYNVSVPDKYKEVCVDIIGNLTKEGETLQDCYDEVDTWKNEIREREVWVEYKYGYLPAGTYEWKIQGKKNTLESIDWIGEVNGVKLTEWAWWDSDWSNKKEVSNLTGQIVQINVSYESNMESDFSDVRFLDGDEEVELGYFIRNKNDEDSALFDIRVNENSTIYMYYGNDVSTTSNLENVFGSNIISYYGLDNNVGSFNGVNNLSSGTGSYVTDGVIGSARSYSGSYTPDSKTSATDFAFGTGNFAVSYWIKTTDTDAYPFGYATAIWTTGGWGIQFHPSQTVGQVRFSRSGSNHPTGQVVNTGNWVHIVFVREGTGTNQFKAYVNGTLTNTLTDNYDYDADTTFTLGGISTARMTGQIDELVIYNSDISSDDVESLYSFNEANAVFGAEETNEGVSISLTNPDNAFETNSQTIDFNATITPTNANITNVTWRAETQEDFQTYNTNETLDLNWTKTFADGSYSWNVTACWIGVSETHSCTESATRTFEIDSTDPILNITYPTGNIVDGYVTSNEKTIYLNWTTIEPNLDSCWYYNQSANVTVTCGDNATFTLPYGEYTHFVYANDSFGNEGQDSITVDYSYTLFENSQTYNSSTIENSLESFSINVSYNSSQYNLISAKLFYNGTSYSSTAQHSGNSVLFSKSLTMPSINISQNVSFKWLFSLTNASGTIYYNSTSINQYVERINASILGSPYTTPFINFTFYDEKTKNIINASISMTLEYGVSSFIRTLTYSDTDEKIKSFAFGLSPNGTYLVKGELSCSKEGYETKLYTLPSQSIDNNTLTNIELYMLNSSDSTSFIIAVRDSSYSSVAGAIVHIQRYYPSTNSWTTVEIIETNIEGKGIGHFVSEDVNYRFLVYVDGVLRLTSTPTRIFCEASPCTITLTLPGDSEFTQFVNTTDLTYSLSYSTTTETYTYSYTDEDATASGGRLWVIQSNLGNSSILTICNTSSGSSSAVLTCDITDYPNGTYYGYAYNIRSTSELIDVLVIQKTRNIVANIGLDGLIWTVLFILGIVMVGLAKPAVAIVFAVGGFIFAVVLGIASVSYLSIITIITMGVIILWQMKT